MTSLFNIPPRAKKLLPALILFLVVMMVVQRRQQVPLKPPELKLVEANLRSAKNTDFTLPTLAGDSLRLADLQGKVVLLNFWATWCPPCREEMPAIEALFQAYHEQGFVVLGVAGDTKGKEVVAPFVAEQNLTFPILLDPDNRVAKQYHVNGIPTIYLLDRQGRVAGSMTGGADWNSPEARALIERVLQE